jgi:hypothetical protein
MGEVPVNWWLASRLGQNPSRADGVRWVREGRAAQFVSRWARCFVCR